MAEDLNVGHKVNENNLAAHVSNTFLSIQRVSYDINNQMIFCNYSIAPQYIKIPDEKIFQITVKYASFSNLRLIKIKSLDEYRQISNVIPLYNDKTY